MKAAYLVALVALMASCKSQMVISLLEYDPNVVTEWNDGKLWAYKSSDDFVVGMTTYPEQDDYGKYYQVNIFVMNLSDRPIVFDPSKVSAQIASGTSSKELEVYTNEEFQKMVRRKQNWTMALYGISAGLNAGMAGYSTTYVNGYVYTSYNPNVAALANMAASAELYSMAETMEYERNIKQVGYLKMHTIYPHEGITGYMNIKRKGGDILVVNIPAGRATYSFQWQIK